MNFTFETREQYVVWRAEWRTSYLELSKIIRKAKLENKAADKAGLSKKYLGPLKMNAREALEERRLSKERAGQQKSLKMVTS